MYVDFHCLCRKIEIVDFLCIFSISLTVDDLRNSNYLEVGQGNQYDYLTLNFGVSDKPLARQGLLKT